MRPVATAGVVGLLAAVLAGCSPAQGPAPGGRDAAIQRGPAPSYPEVVEQYNARLEGLNNLWSRAIVRIWYPDREGEERTEQLEGHLQFIRPRKVNLTLMKVTEPAAVLGSNDTQYWFLELGPRDRKAHVGEHARATPERVAEMGLPLYPLDLIELIGITPLPTEVPAGPSSPSVRWSGDGRELIVNQPTPAGVRRLVLNPATFEPIRMEIVDDRGVLLLASELAGYAPIAIRGGVQTVEQLRVPGEILVTFNRGRTRVRMRLYEPETGGSRPRPGAFEFDTLVRAYRIENVINLDEQPVAYR